MKKLSVQIKIDENDVLRGLSVWHIISGKHVHIAQILKEDGTREYYTDGKKEEFKDELVSVTDNIGDNISDWRH